MIIASGYIETEEIAAAGAVAEELRSRGIEIEAVEEDRIVYLIERPTDGEVKRELDSLKDISGVRGVFLAYYSLEGSDGDGIAADRTDGTATGSMCS